MRRSEDFIACLAILIICSLAFPAKPKEVVDEDAERFLDSVKNYLSETERFKD